jgi:FMN phosphatase YigB (HAD superfamily)
MPLTLEQYATWLDTRDLPWPAPPEPEPPRAKPHLKPLPEVRAVTWNVYGTLLAISGGQFLFQHPTKFVMEAALEKTIQEFKMWGSMSRKPGQPSEYMGHIYDGVLSEQQAFPAGGEKYPEVASDRVWEAILKKLLQKDYRFDTSFYGALNEYSRKIAYFFHASLQGTCCYPGAAAALRHVHDSGLRQGLLGEGQCFTAVQLQRGLARQDEEANLDELIPAGLRTLSYEVRARPPSERLFHQALAALAEEGIEPGAVLHVGSRLQQDLVPAKRLGMKTGLFAGDRASLQVTGEQLKHHSTRPDVLLTELEQIREIVGGS